MEWFNRKRKIESVIPAKILSGNAPKRDEYQFDRYKVILDMMICMGDLQDNNENRELHQRLHDCYYELNGSSKGKILLSLDELILIRRLLGDDDGSIGAWQHQARVELDKTLSGKGIQWRVATPNTNMQQKLQGNRNYLRTHLEVMNSKALFAPVITSLPDIIGILSTPIALSYSADDNGTGYVPLHPNSSIGMLAFRCWNFQDGFLVSSGKGNAIWREVMHSDKLPNAENKSGIYATKLSAYTIMRTTWEFVNPVCGLIRLRGKVVEHRDGILRAEFASIVRIFVVPAWVSNDTLIGQVIREIRYNYPNIPLDIVLPEQLASILTMLTNRTEKVDKEVLDALK